MPRTPTLPPNDKTMWRRLVGRAHPDSGGDHDLFVWSMATRDHVCGGELGSEIPRRPQGSLDHGHHDDRRDRVPFEAAFARVRSFSELTRQAVTVAEEVPETYARLLRFLSDCYEAGELDRPLFRMQNQGATYKSLAALAYKAGLSKEQRVRWYRIAESIPLSQRHAGHILSKLQRRAA